VSTTPDPLGGSALASLNWTRRILFFFYRHSGGSASCSALRQWSESEEEDEDEERVARRKRPSLGRGVKGSRNRIVDSEVRRCTLAVLLLGGSALASLNWTRRILFFFYRHSGGSA
jgi:hypothetical protein